MAKKLKYPYEQWKVQQGKTSPSRSPSPMEEEDHVDDEGFSSSSSSPQALVNTPRSETFQHSPIVYGKFHCINHFGVFNNQKKPGKKIDYTEI